ncbi:hypothetical protein CALVIDRAFT_560218 [Calocera viscosa TUFC12733]|uniref:Uncharacterized protein n=1 Tax=Calocera viscosa (strain TUFC12733) TaxID=1330018 RepID=A0A167RHH6_CALVF|nr:hypothetical protein CALVIDRAFT_560218 [Calocera viscosa TUFC12733]
MLMTTITPYGPAKTEMTSEPPLVEDAEKMNLRHLLAINLKAEGDPRYPPFSQGEDNVAQPTYVNQPIQHPELYETFLSRLRDIVSGDGKDGTPPIDAVSFTHLPEMDPPSERLCQAVDGLRPRLLELECGWDEYCDLKSFDGLETKFPLETLVISGACGEEVQLVSEYLSCVHTLNLHYSHNLCFPRIPPPLALRNMIMTENDAMDSFIRLSDTTHMIDRLESLKLTSTNGCDFYRFEAPEFLAALKKATILRQLDLVTDHRSRWVDPYNLNDLPSHLPENLEQFSFRGAPGIITDATPWLDLVSSPAWLPNLRESSFRLDQPRRQSSNTETGDEGVAQTDAEEIAAAEKTAHWIKTTLADNRPNVDVTF